MDYHFQMLESFYKLKNIHFTTLLPSNITHGECFALIKLKQLSENPERSQITVSDLNKMIDVSAPALSRTLKSLEENGYVTRTPDPQDKRNNFLSLTENGEKVIELVDKQMHTYCRAISERLGEERINDFIQFLDDLYVITSEEIEKIKKEGDLNV